MNNIEEMFFNAFQEFMSSLRDVDKTYPMSVNELKPEVVIGPYRVDFVFGDCVIEIDGHEAHKTKEQRDHDYKRERYLQKAGFTIVRFTGTEVFLDAYSCVRETIDIVNKVEDVKINYCIPYKTVSEVG